MELDKCFERIGYSGPARADLETLRNLQRSFLLHVPFENLDIHLGAEILLDSNRIYEKIVLGRRGGFCYECNMLFADLLSALGFEVAILSARMVQGDWVDPEYDHMSLHVTLDDEYLVDVGNGQSFREPLRIDGTNRTVAERISYRVDTHPDGFALYFSAPLHGWEPRYLFALKAREIHEFAGMCRYHQTSTDSPFTRQRLVTMAREKGRATLKGMQLSVTNGRSTNSREISSETEYTEVLRQYFGVELEATFIDQSLGEAGVQET